tara:strand:+ start:2843 stop:3499 length:657 start_codon:yes stop_codon:yes gene_type:complete
METHKKQFWDLMKEINSSSIDYVVVRGFLRLPDSADNDIDLAPHYKQFDSCMEIIKRHLEKHWHREYGFAEYAFMNNYSYKTKGPDNNLIAEKRFYVDTDSSLFFSSPYKNYETNWVVSHGFNEYVYETKVKKTFDEGYIWIPSPENEMTLQVLRNVLDKRGHWKQKSINRVKDLLPVVDKEELVKSISLVLPCAKRVADSLYNGDFASVNKYSLGGF